ncbi:MAG: hypothetical protein P8186_18590, partial [Anaerolineae bacterium]
QRRLPLFAPEYPEGAEYAAYEGLAPVPRRRLADFQRWQRAHDQRDTALTDLYFNFIGLTQQMGELGAEITVIWRQQKALYEKVGNQPQALDQALTERLPDLQVALADCLTYLLKLANQAGVDLESAYLDKIDQ